MAWTERQREMLAAMGLRLWTPPAAAAAAEPPADPAAPPTPAPAAAPEQLQAAPTSPWPSAAPAPAPARTFAPATAPTAPRAAEPAQPTWTAEPADERAQAIARLDWPGLRQAVADCRACSLCESRQQTVFGVGHAQADWMIVGEAPGEQEDAQGEPFVGPAGQLLDRMLAALGLARTEGSPQQQVFIANTLKCRPPRNRNPAPEEMARCAPFLARQIALVQPRLILAMGRFAIQHLLGTDEAVGKLRGRVHRHAGVPVVVTYHPAYLLRQPADKRKAWDDLCLAAEVAQGQAADPPA